MSFTARGAPASRRGHLSYLRARSVTSGAGGEQGWLAAKNDGEWILTGEIEGIPTPSADVPAISPNSWYCGRRCTAIRRRTIR